jgi:Domain of unknown function (DUF4412)
MKKILICFLLLLTGMARAQNFEGAISWSMKYDITDPALKAKMAEGQQKQADPATQAKMKEMQAKMNDPQMKAMMDANPQMKAQMEAAMKMAQGGNTNSMMPSGFTMKTKGQNTITKVEGGMMAMEVLYLKDKNQSYQLDRQNKTFSVLPSGTGAGQTNETQPKVTKTTETAKILNYNCTKYIVEISEHGQAATEFIWTTTDIKDIDLKSLAKQRVGRGHSIYYEGMEGFPLRIEIKSAQADIMMEVTEIKRETLDASDFAIPADFKETPGMYGKQ